MFVKEKKLKLNFISKKKEKFIDKKNKYKKISSKNFFNATKKKYYLLKNFIKKTYQKNKKKIGQFH